jgi:hypothetical protein
MIRGLAIACAVLAILLGLQTVRIANLKADHAKQDSRRYAQLTEALQADYDRAATHAEQTMENANGLRQAETKRNDSARTAESADSWVRNTISAANAQAAKLDAAACHQRSAALGDLLGEAFSTARENTGAAEQHADELRTCLKQMRIDRERYAAPAI